MCPTRSCDSHVHILTVDSCERYLRPTVALRESLFLKPNLRQFFTPVVLRSGPQPQAFLPTTALSTTSVIILCLFSSASLFTLTLLFLPLLSPDNFPLFFSYHQRYLYLHQFLQQFWSYRIDWHEFRPTLGCSCVCLLCRLKSNVSPGSGRGLIMPEWLAGLEERRMLGVRDECERMPSHGTPCVMCAVSPPIRQTERWVDRRV